MTALSHVLLLRPGVVADRLSALERAGVRVPTVWQVSLGVLRMWHRVLFRSNTIGTSAAGRVRPTWRARLMHNRALRFPFLLWEGAITPLDLSGLRSTPERVRTHLLGAHHDRRMFAYDLELLSYIPGELEQLQKQVDALLANDTPRARWLKDLVAYEGYHENLREAVRCALLGDLRLTPEEANDPDVSFGAYLRWCARQPATPGETLRAWREGSFTVQDGLRS